MKPEKDSAFYNGKYHCESCGNEITKKEDSTNQHVCDKCLWGEKTREPAYENDAEEQDRERYFEKKYGARIITPHGVIIPVQPENKTFSLYELQQIVGGYIEIVPARTAGKVLVINEEGKVKGLPYNQLATREYKHGGADVIVGDALLCDEKMLRDTSKQVFE